MKNKKDKAVSNDRFDRILFSCRLAESLGNKFIKEQLQETLEKEGLELNEIQKTMIKEEFSIII